MYEVFEFMCDPLFCECTSLRTMAQRTSDPATAETSSMVAVATSAPRGRFDCTPTPAPLARLEALEAALAMLEEAPAAFDEAEVALAAREVALLAPELAPEMTDDAPPPTAEVSEENPPPPSEVTEENPLPPRELAALTREVAALWTADVAKQKGNRGG